MAESFISFVEISNEKSGNKNRQLASKITYIEHRQIDDLTKILSTPINPERAIRVAQKMEKLWNRFEKIENMFMKVNMKMRAMNKNVKLQAKAADQLIGQMMMIKQTVDADEAIRHQEDLMNMVEFNTEMDDVKLQLVQRQAELTALNKKMRKVERYEALLNEKRKEEVECKRKVAIKRARLNK